MSEYLTVDEVIAMLKAFSATGLGSYTVVCNGEYYFAKTGENPEIDLERQEISFGGYTR